MELILRSYSTGPRFSLSILSMSTVKVPQLRAECVARGISTSGLRKAELVAALRAHPDSAEVQARGCAALSGLASDNVENKARTGAAGGPEAVVAALRGHPRSAEVQAQGCAALRSLAFGSAESRMRIGAAGGVEATHEHAAL